MSQATHDVVGPARRSDFSTGLSNDQPSGFAPTLRSELRPHYQRIACDQKYRHFVRIPERILRCLDYFQIRSDRVEVSRVLHAYYLFIGVVDNAIDSGAIETGNLVLYYFETSPSANQSTISDVALMTEVLKCHTSNDARAMTLCKLGELYQEVLGEQSATSIESYIEQRKRVGRLTAELSYLLIRPLLQGARHNLGNFMQKVGAVGCLVDSVIDLSADRRLGLLSFSPTIRNYAKLTLYTFLEGLRVMTEHPRLSGLFFRAIGDNVGDRFRKKDSRTHACVVADRRDKAADVA